MTNKQYAKGYRFEKRVQRFLTEKGYKVIRQGRSQFPDLLAYPTKLQKTELIWLPSKVKFNRDEYEKEQRINNNLRDVDEICVERDYNLFVECKNWKTVPKNPLLQLSKDEKNRFKKLDNILLNAIMLLAYNDNKKIKFVKVI